MAAQHQHYVPRLLLRGFLSQVGKEARQQQVRVFDLENQKTFTASIEKIMGERRFNEWWMDDETIMTIEPATSRIETYVTPLVDRIRNEKRLNRTPEEVADLALLMAFQFLRTKRMRLLPRSLNEQLIQHVRRLGYDPAKVDGIIEWGEEALKVQHTKMQVEGLPKYVEVISEKEFFLMVPPPGQTFYLGDHPVVLHNDERERVGLGGLGIGVPYIQIYLPIAADVMLCAYDKAILGQLMRLRDEGVRDAQNAALGQLRRGVITAHQMKGFIESVIDAAPVTTLISAIRAGEAVTIQPDSVQTYNALQVYQAHRFVVAPDGNFALAREVCAEHRRADLSEKKHTFEEEEAI